MRPTPITVISLALSAHRAELRGEPILAEAISNAAWWARGLTHLATTYGPSIRAAQYAIGG
jgi:hypothetical protein